MSDEPKNASHADTLSYSDAQAPGPPEKVSVELGPGSLVGRYVVLSKLGEGGMGAVFAAHDPELDRKVALKFLHSRLTGSDRGPVQETRLFREGQAMAKLAHANVASVYDVGSYRGRVYIAMEFINGQTFGDWLEAERRSWSEIWPVLRGAGRGLAAAHAAGIVHRDFKPDNILVSRDGVAKVTDFGLAAPSGEHTKGGAGTEISSGALHEPLTRTGSLVGTPRYMAPEQHLAQPTTERTDQFAFCLVAFYAMYGEHAFAGDTIAELAEAVTNGELTQPSRRSVAPSWCRAAVMRGLSTEPDDRYASMNQLLDALGRDPRARRNRIMAGVAIVAAVAAALALLWPARAAQPTAMCTTSAEAIAPTWNDQTRAQLRSAFGASGAANAEDRASRVIKVLDNYTDKWVAQHQQSCMATLRGAQSEEMLDLRSRCLKSHRARIRGLIQVLTNSPSKATVRKATEAAQGLPHLDECADLRRLRELTPPPADPEARRRIDDLEARYSYAYSLWDTSDSVRALEVLQPLIEPITKTGYPPLIAAARELQFNLLFEMGKSAEAQRAFDAAVANASRAGEDRRVARLWMNQTLYAGQRDHNLKQALVYARVTRAAIQRAGAVPAQLAQYQFVMAAILMDGGKYQRALKHAKTALALFEKHRPDDLMRIGRTRGLLAQGLFNMSKYDECEKQATKAIAQLESALGPHHIAVGRALVTLSENHTMQDHSKAAIATLRRAVAIYDETFGADSLEAIDTKSDLGWALLRAGDYKASDRLCTSLVATIDAKKLTGAIVDHVLQHAASGQKHSRQARCRTQAAGARDRWDSPTTR